VQIAEHLYKRASRFCTDALDAEIRALWSRLEFTGLDQDTECAIAAIGGGLFG
jgi:hypothetical protein